MNQSGRILLIYAEKDEALAVPVKEFLQALGAENVLMFSQEPGSPLTAEEKEDRYYRKAGFAVIVSPQDENDLRLLTKHFGGNPGTFHHLFDKGSDLPQALSSLARLIQRLKDAKALEPADMGEGIEAAARTLHSSLDRLLRSVLLEVSGQERGQIGLDLFSKILQARHGKSPEEAAAISKELTSLGLLEESQVLGRGFLKLTRKGAQVAQLERKSRPKNLIDSVFKEKPR